MTITKITCGNKIKKKTVINCIREFIEFEDKTMKQLNEMKEKELEKNKGESDVKENTFMDRMKRTQVLKTKLNKQKL